MIDNYEFEIYYGEIEEPLYLTNDKNYICDDMRDFMEATRNSNGRSNI